MTIWGGGLRWSYSSQAWLGLFANLQDGRVLLRHEMSWNGVSCEEAAEDIVKEIKRRPPLCYRAEMVGMAGFEPALSTL